MGLWIFDLCCFSQEKLNLFHQKATVRNLFLVLQRRPVTQQSFPRSFVTGFRIDKYVARGWRFLDFKFGAMDYTSRTMDRLQYNTGTTEGIASLGISVHCLAVFCLCHHFRFPGGHRHHFLLSRQIEMIKWQIGTHTQLEFSQFETDACPASGRAWITVGCSIIHNDKHTILFFCCRSTSYQWHSR